MAVVKDTFATVANFTLTLASLANSTAGVGRQATMVDNTANLYTSALINLNIKVGTTPTVNSLIYAYLIRSNNAGTAIADDGAGAADAALTVINAPLLGTILVSANTTGANYQQNLDTKFLGSLGPKWTIAIVNSSGVALNAVEGVYSYIGVTQTVA